MTAYAHIHILIVDGSGKPECEKLKGSDSLIKVGGTQITASQQLASLLLAGH
jgi:hypothetical protein